MINFVDEREILMDPSTWSPDLCQKDAVLVQFFLNRALKFIGLAFCAISVPLTMAVIKKFILPGAFHKNIKIILVFYFINALFQSISLPVFMIVMLRKSYSVDPCGIYLPRSFLMFGQLINCYLLLTQINLQAVACIERVLATLCSASYEKQTSAIGICFSLIALLSPLPIEYWIYHDEDFDEPSPSVLIAPKNIAFRINIVFIYGIVLCVISLCLVISLRCHNRRKIKDIVGEVTHRFQTNENIQTTSFIIIILSLQLFVFLIAGCGLLFLRLTVSFWDNYDLTYRTIKTSLYVSQHLETKCVQLVPVFLLLLPLLTIWQFKHGKKQREKTSWDHMSIKTTGKEGIENYKKIIYDQWY